MKITASIFAVMLLMGATAACFANGAKPPADTTTIPPSGAGPVSPAPAAPPTASMQMPSMSEMSGMSHPGITVDNTYVYIVRNGQLMRFDKQTLKLVSVTPIPAVTQPPIGAGPGMICPPPAAPPRLSNADRLQIERNNAAYAESLVQQQRGAIAWSRIVAVRACHPELKSFAQCIVQTEGEENTRLSSELINTYGVRRSPSLTPYDRDVQAQLNATGGQDLEQKYMRAMIAHNNAEIAMARCVEQNSNNCDLRQTAANRIATLTAQNQQLAAWLCAWYGQTY